ncbi:MAG: [FeFe] hydrogenase H-cluster maturation GTPase HydF [Eubacteriales bacterium]|nr:[FeFe] hydrogenase H-cluster maturation GTPase HydF [Eubacteriales bacterium]
MGLNATPSAERVHIGIFGKRNAGKSSLINAMTGQELAIVSDIAGTTTDPVTKAMELLPLGPVVMIDTPGLDDTGELGAQRVRKAMQVMNRCDLAVVAIDALEGQTDAHTDLLTRLTAKNIPHVIAMNKCDLLDTVPPDTEQVRYVSATTGAGIYDLKEKIAHLVPSGNNGRRIVADLLQPNDFVVLVVPIDSAAPKGRLILPQQQTIRDILEAGACSIVCRETELASTLEKLGQPPRMVITDSQAFASVSKDTPQDVPLTSFSILMARYKGRLESAVHGVRTLETLQDGDTVLISEGCTHHRQCDDIGTVKLPRWIKEYTGKNLNFAFTSGGEFPDDLTPYQLIVHCGGCMLNEREMKYRIARAQDDGVPMTNYGILISYINGILERAIEPLADSL